jgi:hypothetical protein
MEFWGVIFLRVIEIFQFPVPDSNNAPMKDSNGAQTCCRALNTLPGRGEI